MTGLGVGEGKAWAWAWEEKGEGGLRNGGVLAAGQGGGQGGDGGVRREADCGKPNNAKIPGARGLSHTSNNASSLQSAIGLVRYLRDAGDGKEAKQIQLIGEGEREPGARASGQESALGAVAGKDWKLRRMGWNASHGGVVQCRWGCTDCKSWEPHGTYLVLVGHGSPGCAANTPV